jgi:alpha-beta hydrolase superfamily lysophospholipase
MRKMKHQEYEWMLDGKRVFAQSWIPDREPKAVVDLVHGLGQHSGRYDRWGTLFSGAGYAMLAIDLFGHGRTEGRTGHVKNYQSLLDQVDLMLNKSGEIFPGVPRILYGHSMGGNIVINYTITRDPPIAALIASSPWLRLVKPISGIEKLFARVADSLAPGLTIKTGRIDPEMICRDPEQWTQIRDDPMMHRKISIRYAHSINTMGEFALRHVYRINRPFLIMHGDADEITSHLASEKFVANTSERTRLKIWEGFRHELQSEPEYRDVFQYVVNWIEELNL